MCAHETRQRPGRCLQEKEMGTKELENRNGSFGAGENDSLPLGRNGTKARRCR